MIEEAQEFLEVLSLDRKFTEIFATTLKMGPCAIFLPSPAWFNLANDWNSRWNEIIFKPRDVLYHIVSTPLGPTSFMSYTAVTLKTAARTPIKTSNTLAQQFPLLKQSIKIANKVIFFTDTPLTCPANRLRVNSEISQYSSHQALETIYQFMDRTGCTIFASLYLKVFKNFISKNKINATYVTIFVVKDHTLLLLNDEYKDGFNSTIGKNVSNFFLSHLIVHNPENIDPTDGSLYSEQMMNPMSIKNAAGDSLLTTVQEGRLFIQLHGKEVGFREFNQCKLDGVVHVIREPLVRASNDKKTAKRSDVEIEKLDRYTSVTVTILVIGLNVAFVVVISLAL
ncbi:hypothetical protein ACOME3_000093 [Neoechinorhynchus agilis]